jgi:preprotein translocase subunit SecY
MVLDPKVTTYLVIATVLAAGTAFLMWIGEQLNEYGVGNGISILIFAGIVSRFPTQVHQLYSLWFTGDAADQMFMNIVKVIVVILVIIGIIAGVIFIQQGVRKIPIQYAQQVTGRQAVGGQNTHLPLKVNAAGVIPVIFALSLLFFPATIAQFWSTHAWAKWITNNLTYQQPLGMVLYVLLIVGFTYFYTFVQMNPVQMADDLKKNGGYIPGIRPGEPTGVYLSRVMSRITLFGALFLAVISALPIYFGKLASLPTSISIGGTSLLIVIGVALDTMKQINSQLMKRHYKGFINK